LDDPTNIARIDANEVNKICEGLEGVRGWKILWLENYLAALKEKDKLFIFTETYYLINEMKAMVKDCGLQGIELHGDCSIEERQTAIDKFTNGDSCQVFVLMLAAGGIGINLAKANQIIFFSTPLLSILAKQAISRAHRQGQTREVDVW
jgi:SWI/SNF-related matrix-associated actin-dependent regulator 1 of chromatin subfamily A